MRRCPFWLNQLQNTFLHASYWVRFLNLHRLVVALIVFVGMFKRARLGTEFTNQQNVIKIGKRTYTLEEHVQAARNAAAKAREILITENLSGNFPGSMLFSLRHVA